MVFNDAWRKMITTTNITNNTYQGVSLETLTALLKAQSDVHELRLSEIYQALQAGRQVQQIAPPALDPWMLEHPHRP
jgi:hypothetical protein